MTRSSLKYSGVHSKRLGGSTPETTSVPPVAQQPERGLDCLGRADRVVDDGRAVLQPVALAPRLQRRRPDPAGDLRDELVGRGRQHGVRAEPGGEPGPCARPRRGPYLGGRDTGGEAARSPRTRACPSRKRGRGWPAGGGASRIDRSETLTGSASTAASSRDAVGDGEQLRDVRGEALGVRAGRRRAVPDVDGDGQVAGAEVAAPRVAARPASRAWRVDAAGPARQPRVEHDPLAGVGAAADDLVPEHVREGDQRGERVVPGAVQQDLLHVRAAQARERRLARGPSPRPGSGSSSTSSMRTGANRDTNARRSTRPPMVEAASRARLCWNTSAFTSTSFGADRPYRYG